MNNQSKPSPITVPCPACQAPVMQPCSVPTDTGRRNVSWYHMAREDLANEQDY